MVSEHDCPIMELEQNVQFNVLSRIVQIGMFGVANAMAAGLVTYVLFRDLVEPLLINIWLASILIASLLRAVLLGRFWKLEMRDRSLRAWTIAFLILIYIPAACWGVLPLFPAFQTTDWAHSFIIFIIAGMSASGTASLHPLLRASIPYLLICLVPLAVTLGRSGDPTQITMAIMVVLFAVMQVRATLTLNRSMQQAIRLDLENRQLFRFMKNTGAVTETDPDAPDTIDPDSSQLGEKNSTDTSNVYKISSAK